MHFVTARPKTNYSVWFWGGGVYGVGRRDNILCVPKIHTFPIDIESYKLDLDHTRLNY